MSIPKLRIFADLDRIGEAGSDPRQQHLVDLPSPALPLARSVPSGDQHALLSTPVPLMALVELINGAQTSAAPTPRSEEVDGRSARRRSRPAQPGLRVNRTLCPMIKSSSGVCARRGAGDRGRDDEAMKSAATIRSACSRPANLDRPGRRAGGDAGPLRGHQGSSIVTAATRRDDRGRATSTAKSGKWALRPAG